MGKMMLGTGNKEMRGLKQEDKVKVKIKVDRIQL